MPENLRHLEVVYKVVCFSSKYRSDDMPAFITGLVEPVELPAVVSEKDDISELCTLNHQAGKRSIIVHNQP